MSNQFKIGARIALRGTVDSKIRDYGYNILFDGADFTSHVSEVAMHKARHLVPKKKHDHARCYDHHDYLEMKEKHDALEKRLEHIKFVARKLAYNLPTDRRTNDLLDVIFERIKQYAPMNGDRE